MKRKVTQLLVDWKNNLRRMPLIINGARQVGKTFSVEEFVREHYDNVVYRMLHPDVKSGCNCNSIYTSHRGLV